MAEDVVNLSLSDPASVCEVSIPESEDVCQLEEGGVDEDGERVLLEEFGEEDHGLALLPQLPRAQTWGRSRDVTGAMHNTDASRGGGHNTQSRVLAR